jgi:hypothetical protein
MEQSFIKPELEKKLLWAVLGIYAVAILFGVMNHEAWRDEAQSWLVTRDNSFINLFKILPSEGHPPLWYLVLTPFVKAGLPYEFQNWLAGLFMIGAVYIILFRTQVHLFVKLLLPFSYFFLFEFGLFARSYCLVVFFLSLVISLYPKRFDKPIPFALCVAALFNTHMLMFAFSASVTGIYLLDAIQYKKMNAPTMGAFAIMCVLGFYLFPYIGMADTADIFVPEIKDVWKEISLTMSFGLLVSENADAGVLLFLLLCVPLLTRTKPFLILLGGCAGLFYILGIQFIGSIRHCGILLLILFAAYAIAVNYKDDAMNYIKSNTLKPEYGNWLLALVMLLQFKDAFGKYKDDIDRVYSDSKNAAHYILEHNLENKVIAAHSAAYACTLLPYLPSDKRMYYPEYPRYGSYYTNDSFYVKGVWNKPDEHYVQVVKDNFKGKLDDVIFVFNHSIDPKLAAKMEHLYSTQEPAMFPMEMFIICKLKKEYQ